MEPNTKFKKLRKQLKLSQIEFAAKIGVSQGTIGDIERGRIGISKSVKLKIIEKLGIESGYFDADNEQQNIESSQGNESGSTQGFDLRNNLFYNPNKKLSTKSKIIDAATLSDEEIIKIYTDKESQTWVTNVSPERQIALTKVFEKQKVIAEKAINVLTSEKPEYNQFRKDLFAIQSFENILDNLINCSQLNELFKIEDSARRYRSVSYKDFKSNLFADYIKIAPHKHIFSNLAKAMKAFVDKASQIPEDLTGIGIEEYEEYQVMNG